jgi:hypothetical protein
MMRRLARPYAVTGWIAALVGALGAIALRLIDPVPVIPDTLGFGDTALVGFEFLGVMFASVGAFLVVRLPENVVGWCMVLIGACTALSGLTGAVTYSAVAQGPAAAATAGLAGWLTTLFVTVGNGLVPVLGLIFPTGRGQTQAWDRFVRLGVPATLLVLVVLILIRPGPLQVFATIDNPFGFGPDLRPVLGSQLSMIVAALSVSLAPLLAMSIISRYRLSDAVGRQQLKWFVLSLLATLGSFTAASIGAVISNEPPEAGIALFGFAGALIPIAIGIAILRHNLYDIDRIVSRTIAYGLVSAILAVAFGGLIVFLSAALSSFAQGETIAVATSTLAACAAFQPVLRGVRREVDRRFDRAAYDAERTVAEFSDRLRGEIDLAQLSGDLDATIRDVIAPQSIAIWLRANGRRPTAP